MIALNRLNRILRARSGAAHRGGRAGRGQPRRVEGGRAARPVLRARPVQPADLHHRRQRRLQFGRRALPEVRHDRQPRARHQGGAARRRGRRARRRSLENVGPDLVGLFVGSRRAASASRSRSRCDCCRGPEAFTPCSPPTTPRSGRRRGRRVVAAGLLPGAMEIMDRLAIEAAEAAVHAGVSAGRRGVLIVELEGEAEPVDAELERLTRDDRRHRAPTRCASRATPTSARASGRAARARSRRSAG